MRNNRKNTFEILLAVYLVCYFIVSLKTLTLFPFVHSDEAWLSGLTRNMMDTWNLGITESFFDLKPRYPHGIKTLFHLLQMPVISLLGYEIFNLRLLSLLFGCLCLLAFYKLLDRLFKTSAPLWLPLLGTLLLSLNIQFIYASHMARQEIVLLFFLLLCLLALQREHYLLAGLVTGLSIGIHPNSFLIGVMGVVLLIPVWREKKWKPLLGYTGITAGFALFFVSLSLFFDRDFFRHYFEYGNSEFDVGAPLTGKLAGFPLYLIKIWHQISGTYYLPDIRLEMVLFLAALGGGIFLLLAGSQKEKADAAFLLKGLVGLVLGMILIGRYNQTSIIFLFPLLLTLLIYVLFTGIGRLSFQKKGKDKGVLLVLSLVILLTGISSCHNILPWTGSSYGDYLKEISKAVSPEDKVLANLNSDYYFRNGKLLDYRNLSYLKDSSLSVEEYLKKSKIEYIILSDELDLIYAKRPNWNIIYGNLRYLDELHAYTRDHCTLIHSFTNNTYGTRISPYINSDTDFTVKIFKVKDFSGQ